MPNWAFVANRDQTWRKGIYIEDMGQQALKHYDELNFFLPSNRGREFLWNLFAPHYLEMVKARAYEGG